MANRIVERFELFGEIFDIHQADFTGAQADLYTVGYLPGQTEIRTYDFNVLKTEIGTALIDVGTLNTTGTKSFLDSIEVSHIDVIMLSHYHGDHVDNLPHILEIVDTQGCVAYIPPEPPTYADESVKNNYNAVIAALDAKGIERHFPTEKQTVTHIGCKFTFYNTSVLPYTSTNFNYNNCSVCVRCEYLGNSVFFTGDIVALAQAYLASIDIPHSDLVKIAHHGYNRFCNRDYFEMVSASYYFCSNGQGIGNDGYDDLGRFNVEGAFAHHAQIPIYATGNAPDNILHIKFGGGMFQSNTEERKNLITQVPTAGNLGELTMQNADDVANMNLPTLLGYIGDKQTAHAILPSRYLATPTDHRYLASITKNDASVYGDSFRGYPKAIGNMTECARHTGYQSIDFMVSPKGDSDNSTPFGFIHNGSFGNWYLFTANITSSNNSDIPTTLNDYLGSDIIQSGNRIYAARHFRAMIQLNINVPAHDGIGSVTFNQGEGVNQHTIRFPAWSGSGDQTNSWVGCYNLTEGLPIYFRSDQTGGSIRGTIIVMSYRWDINDSYIGVTN